VPCASRAVRGPARTASPKDGRDSTPPHSSDTRWHSHFFGCSRHYVHTAGVVWIAPECRCQLPNGTAIDAEVSTSWSALKRGLMGMSSLPAGRGMLFVYPTVGRHWHWMYGCLIPLDIVWLSEDKHIVEIVASRRPCKTMPCASFEQRSSSRFVLEIGRRRSRATRVANRRPAAVLDQRACIGRWQPTISTRRCRGPSLRS
jgi:uncharacterized membrane protein (UPF0127 family)